MMRHIGTIWDDLTQFGTIWDTCQKSRGFVRVLLEIRSRMGLVYFLKMGLCPSIGGTKLKQR